MAEVKVRKFNYSLEGLRGICALTVALAHVQTGMILFPTINQIIEYSHFAHLAVLIFFMLSGYVIGVNYPGDRLNKKDYLIKRIFRIYPIYLLVILFCFSFEPGLNLSKVLGAIFLLQGWTDRLVTNVVLWSIHYEIIFYLLFIFIAKSKKNIVIQAVVCLALGMSVWVFKSIPPIFGGYFCGFAFWLTGLYISKLSPTPNTNSKSALLSLFFLAMVYNHLAPGGVLLNAIGLKNNNLDMVSAADIINMIPCFLIIVEAGNIAINRKLLLALYFAAIAFPAMIIGLLLYLGRIHENFRWELSGILLALAVVLFFIKQRYDLLKSIAWLGGVSYSIYIIHWPIGYLMGQIFTPQSPWEKAGYFVLWLLLVLTLSWMLEKKFQRFLKEKFFPHKTTTVAAVPVGY